ncbi:hypothetical protein DU490_05820 [Halomonas sp. DQ26W]|nr:hypothetical protein DU490_05820 [Halomonas sp. DQ26W]
MAVIVLFLLQVAIGLAEVNQIGLVAHASRAVVTRTQKCRPDGGMIIQDSGMPPRFRSATTSGLNACELVLS